MLIMIVDIVALKILGFRLSMCSDWALMVICISRQQVLLVLKLMSDHHEIVSTWENELKNADYLKSFTEIKTYSMIEEIRQIFPGVG
jgi:hypothetical protein